LRCYNLWSVPASRSPRTLAESGGRRLERAESGSRRLQRADMLAKPAAARPGSSEVEQPPCKRPVGGSNPFPGSRLRSPSAPSHLLKSRWRLLPYSGAPHRVPRGRGRGCARAAKGSRLEICRLRLRRFESSRPHTDGICPCSSVGRALPW
jgi:hypothetical protein